VICDNDLVLDISHYFHRDSGRQLVDVLLEVLCFYVDKFSLSSGLRIAFLLSSKRYDLLIDIWLRL
jgi:hypothetical protein